VPKYGLLSFVSSPVNVSWITSAVTAVEQTE